MDITKFNKILNLLVNKAKIAEKNNNLKDAVDVWIEITELTLKASKNPKLEFTFRNMLYNRTKGIIEHIKELKNELNKLKIKPIIIQKPKEKKSNEIREDIPKPAMIKEPDIQKEINVETNENKIQEERFNAIQRDFEIIENSQFKNLPKGVKEIKASNKFEILAPHDPEYVEKRINQDIDMSIFAQNNSSANNNEIQLENYNQKGNKICFACGQEVPAKSTKCINCGTELKF